jgi:thiol-disulfide isomerase/thioredoxin
MRAVGVIIALLAFLPAAAPAAVGVGEAAPGFTLPDGEGRRVTVPDPGASKVTLVDFWASWCATCAAALPALDVLARRHAAAGLVVVAVGIDRDRVRAERFLREHLPAPAMTVLYDPESAVLARFGAPAMPALYLVDRGGTVRLVESGYETKDVEAVEAELRRLLAPGPSTPAAPGGDDRRRTTGG